MLPVYRAGWTSISSSVCNYKIWRWSFLGHLTTWDAEIWGQGYYRGTGKFCRNNRNFKSWKRLYEIYSIVSVWKRKHRLRLSIRSYVFNTTFSNSTQGPSWSWSYGSWIYNYLCNQCLSPLTLWARIPLRRGVPNTILCDKVCQWLAAGRTPPPIKLTGMIWLKYCWKWR